MQGYAGCESGKQSNGNRKPTARIARTPFESFRSRPPAYQQPPFHHLPQLLLMPCHAGVPNHQTARHVLFPTHPCWVMLTDLTCMVTKESGVHRSMAASIRADSGGLRLPLLAHPPFLTPDSCRSSKHVPTTALRGTFMFRRCFGGGPAHPGADSDRRAVSVINKRVRPDPANNHVRRYHDQ